MDHASCLTVLVLDHRPQYLCTSHSSLLTMPIGGASLLQYIVSQISRSLGANSPTLVPTFEITAEYIQATQQIMPGVCIQGAEEAPERLGDLEPSDWVLIVDPAMWPAEGLDLVRMGGEIRDARVATHLITLASEPGLTGERIQLDASNRIRRIQRSYFGITDLRSSGVVASMIPVSALRSLSGSLQLEPVELRGRMSANGLPIRDITAPGIALNLRDKVQMLNFNKLVLKQKIPHFLPWGQSASSNAGVFREQGVAVHGTARLIGPVVLRENCKIGAGAVLLGPVVVGRNAEVGSKAVVANTILDHGTQVPADAVFCDQIAGEKLEHALSVERIPQILK
ncbi:MAG: hypothetical protein IPK83_03645 [Planctomycetes bacterium]|nr:hypothetical protein [Planctomycetota bacterium]